MKPTTANGTALRWASEAGDAARVKELLGRKANVHEREPYGGYTALHYATNISVAKLLLAANAYAHEKSYGGTTPLQLAQRRNNADLVKVLSTAEVEESLQLARMESRRQLSAEELHNSLLSRGIPDRESLELTPAEVMIELRQDERLRNLMVLACAVQDLEALLELNSPFQLSDHSKLLSAVQADDLPEVQRLLGCVENCSEVLLQRDPQGCLALHYCRSLAMYRFVVSLDGRAEDVKDRRGRLPLECLWEVAGNLAMFQDIWSAGATSAGESDRAPLGTEVSRLLRLDDHGVSIAMRLEGKAKDWLLEQISPWDELQKLLKLPEALPQSLQERVHPIGFWREVLAFHLFSEAEVWKEGGVSAVLLGRGDEFGSCLRHVCQRVLKRSPEEDAQQAMQTLEMLLEATKGPTKLHDARAPYRKELSLEMLHLSLQSEAIHDVLYAMLSGQAAQCLKSLVENSVWEQVDPYGIIRPDPLQLKKERFRLRHHFTTAEGGPPLVPPAWVRTYPGKEAHQLDLQVVLRDLKQVGGDALMTCLGEECIGDFGTGDLAYRMLEGLFGFDPEHFPRAYTDFCEPCVVYWYMLWLRGVCTSQHEAVMQGLEKSLFLLEPKVVRGSHPSDKSGNFFPNLTTMSLKELAAATLEELQLLIEESQGPSKDARSEGFDPAKVPPRELLHMAASFVVGMNKATLIFEDTSHLWEAFRLLRQNCGILQVANTFHKKSPSTSENRRLKVWVPIQVGKTSLIAEVTLMLAESYWENCWHNFPLQYFSGHFDHSGTPARPSKEAFEKHFKAKFQLNPALIPDSHNKHHGDDVDEETQRRIRELQERKARENERRAQEEARRKKEELERRMREASADYDPEDCIVVGNMVIRPPVEVLPKTRRGEAKEMQKLERFNAKKAQKAAAAAAAAAEAQATMQQSEEEEEDDVTKEHENENDDLGLEGANDDPGALKLTEAAGEESDEVAQSAKMAEGEEETN